MALLRVLRLGKTGFPVPAPHLMFGARFCAEGHSSSCFSGLHRGVFARLGGFVPLDSPNWCRILNCAYQQARRMAGPIKSPRVLPTCLPSGYGCVAWSLSFVVLALSSLCSAVFVFRVFALVEKREPGETKALGGGPRVVIFIQFLTPCKLFVLLRVWGPGLGFVA